MEGDILVLIVNNIYEATNIMLFSSNNIRITHTSLIILNYRHISFDSVKTVEAGMRHTYPLSRRVP